jgi:hypothetical protein
VLVPARHLRIVRVDTRARAGSPVKVAGAEHDFREAGVAGTFARELGADDRLDRIVRQTRDDAAVESVLTAVVKNRKWNGASGNAAASTSLANGDESGGGDWAVNR